MGTRQKNSKKKKEAFDIDALENMTPKEQNMVFSILGKYKGVLIPLLLFILLNIICMILTLLLTFKLI